MNKKEARLKRGLKTRKVIRRLKDRPRLSVHRTPRHLYTQLIEPVSGKVLVCASTVEKSFREVQKNTGNVEAAKKLGALIAERAKAAGVTKLAFDRSGFKYHGRIKAMAEAAREGGLDF